MTQNEKLTLRNKARTTLIALITQEIGYPNCSNEQIMDQVGPMWTQLKDSNLISEGMTFQEFIASAQKKYMEREMWRMMGL
jgi:hypothetical protein